MSFSLRRETPHFWCGENVMSKNEITFLVVLIAIVWTYAAVNLLQSQILARDIQRKNDLKHIATALNDYLKEVGSYPSSRDGKLLSCFDSSKNLRSCEWGQDALESTTSAYIKPLPEDPLEHQGKNFYVYLSNTRNFQIFTYLERQDDDEFNKKVEERNISCGINSICNFGVASGS